MAPAAFKRLEIIIQGIAQRTVSAVDDLVEEMKASGVSNEVIKDRIMQEVESGRVLSELRSFATARCPGFVGEMTNRFARDTLAVRQAAIEALRSSARDEKRSPEDLSTIQTSAVERMRAAIEEADTDEEAKRAQAILDIYERSGIDVTAFEGDTLPQPPVDAELTDEYMWVAVQDNRTCEVCEGNHGEVLTLGEWVKIGEPRSGACLGDQNCRCILVPVMALSESEQSGLREHGPINPSNS